MAVANRQVAAATNNSEDLERLEKTAPDAHKNIKIIWTSPIIPLDPLVWRKDLDPTVKTKLYTFLLSYGRLGTADEISTARTILANLVWSPFNPSSDAQLLPIRTLEASRNLARVENDDKLTAAEKDKQTAAIRADLAKLDAAAKAAADDAFHKQVAAFIAADKAGDRDTVKAMIAQFAAALAQTH
jgi:phosphonate transport system substrate-binding protein